MERILPRALGVGLLAVGGGAMLAPRASAGQFGLTSDDPSAHGFARAMGARDVILAALVLTALGNPALLRRTLGITSLIGLGDAFALASVRGLRPQHLIHVSGFVAFALAAWSVKD